MYELQPICQIYVKPRRVPPVGIDFYLLKTYTYNVYTSDGLFDSGDWRL